MLPGVGRMIVLPWLDLDSSDPPCESRDNCSSSSFRHAEAKCRRFSLLAPLPANLRCRDPVTVGEEKGEEEVFLMALPEVRRKVGISGGLFPIISRLRLFYYSSNTNLQNILYWNIIRPMRPTL